MDTNCCKSVPNDRLFDCLTLIRNLLIYDLRIKHITLFFYQIFFKDTFEKIMIHKNSNIVSKNTILDSIINFIEVPTPLEISKRFLFSNTLVLSP